MGAASRWRCAARGCGRRCRRSPACARATPQVRRLERTQRFSGMCLDPDHSAVHLHAYTRLRAHLHLALGMPQQRDQTIASPQQLWSLGQLSTRLGPCFITTTAMLAQRIPHALLQSRGCSSWSGCGVRCRRPPPPTHRWRAGCSWGRCGRGWRRRARGSSLHRQQRHRHGNPKSTSGCPTRFNELLFMMFASAWPL